MIQTYKLGDHLKLDANEFSDWDRIREILTDDKWWKYTVWDNDSVRAVVCFLEYESTHFALLGLFAKNMAVKHGRELKLFLENGIDRLKATRVRTWSKDCPMLNRWHEFLGFEIVEPVELNGDKLFLWELTV